MRENLLGYLMGALDESERAQVQAALEVDPALAAECARLEQTIAPLSEDEDWIDPPSRLAERTIGLVSAYQDCEAKDMEAADAESNFLHRETTLAALNVGEWDDGPGQPVSATATSTYEAFSAERPLRRRWTLADGIVALGICAAAAILILPAIANSRRQAAISQCQNNLRQIGQALVDYSYDHHGQFPLVPAAGNLGVAGFYAPLLKEANRITNDNVFLCPGSTLAEAEGEFVVPNSEEVLQQQGKTLLASQRKMGGSYGYAFGHQDDNGLYCANVNRSRPRFAILADSPSLHLKDHKSANHGGCGQNVLFEDNHVEYLKRCCASETDNLFLSDRGFVEAGRHWNDAVIGNSWARPILSRDSQR